MVGIAGHTLRASACQFTVRNNMLPEDLSNKRVLAIDPISRGFGFVVLEGLEMLLDWGVKQTKGDKNTQCLRRIIDLIYIYQPAAIIFENVNEPPMPACSQIAERRSVIRLCPRHRGVHRFATAGANCFSAIW